MTTATAITYEEMADVSRWQVKVDFDLYKHKRIALKCTDGKGYVDPDYVERAKAAHDHGIGVDHYCFAEGEDGKAQAEFYLEHLIWKDGDRPAIDIEIGAVTAAVVEAFIDTVHFAKPSVPGLEYSSPAFMEEHHIELYRGWGAWIAQWTAASQPNLPPGVDAWTLWQFTNTAVVPGISGRCDLSRIAPVVKPPKPSPNPHAPTPFAHDMHDAVALATRRYDDRVRDDHPMDPGAKTKTNALIRSATKALKIKELK